MPDASLPIVMPAVQDQSWDCHSCTRCCRELVVHLMDADKERIDDQGWGSRLDVPPYVLAGRQWALNKGDDGACVFLADDGKCRIHSEYGFDAKPLACRMYPFTLTPIGGTWQAAWRFDCPSVARSHGAPVGRHRTTLSRLRREMPGPVPASPSEVELKRKRSASDREVNTITEKLSDWLGDNDRPLDACLAGMAELADTLAAANLNAVRDERFVELVDLLLTDLPAAVSTAPREPPGPRQQSLFRQFVFAHTERLTLDEIRSPWTRISRRFRQLRWSRAFRIGTGEVPSWSGRGVVRFADLETVRPARQARDEIAAMVRRFVRMRVLARLHFGAPFNGWTVLDGLQGLCASTAVVGWLARHAVLERGGDEIRVDDAVSAIAVVDGALARPRSLATTGERLRLQFLTQDQGLARLLWQWRLIEGD
jgi:Fe-S-cluster containining protein